MNWRGILLFTLIFKRGICFQNCRPNIAVIGGGIGGASTSHFLAELFNNNLNIDLYEVKTIGGRLATVDVDNYEFEAGGSIIHPKNEYMGRFVKLLGLEQKPIHSERAGIWNGQEFVFEESKWDIISFGKLFYLYGIQPFSLYRYVNSILTDFAKIYDLQDAGKSFLNVTSLLSAMNAEFPKLLEVSIKQHLLNLGYAEKLIDELVNAALVVDYGQSTNVHTFVGAVALAGSGSDLWSVKGGNKKVPEHLLYRNKNVNVIPAYVRKIINVQTNDSTDSYVLHYSNKGSTIEMTSVYDIVIIATPLTSDQQFPIEFEGFPKNKFSTIEKYHQTVATFVTGDLKPNHFGLEEGVDTILSCNPKKTIINSIGRLNSVEGNMKHSRVWKIFSNAPLKTEIAKEMLSNANIAKEVIWKAYPEYSTDINQAKFKLHDALYHVNAIEWAASAMEMSAIGGRNVAILAYEDFTKNRSCKKADTVQSAIHGETITKNVEL